MKLALSLFLLSTVAASDAVLVPLNEGENTESDWDRTHHVVEDSSMTQEEHNLEMERRADADRSLFASSESMTSDFPSLAPSMVPSSSPSTKAPAEEPCSGPTLFCLCERGPGIARWCQPFAPTQVPSDAPSLVPSVVPTLLPTLSPTVSQVPTPIPTLKPTKMPKEDKNAETSAPTFIPTTQPPVVCLEEHSAAYCRFVDGRFGGRRGLKETAVGVPSIKPQFDFALFGFPQTGGTTLLKAFEKHSGTRVASEERCSWIAPEHTDEQAYDKMNQDLFEVSTSSDRGTKAGFKCSDAVISQKSIHRMEQHSPYAKLIVGLRHPIEMLQSLYNDRVTEIYHSRVDEDIPAFEDVVAAAKPWKGVSLDAMRYELFLMQFGKTVAALEDLEEMESFRGFDLAIRPNSFPIFLYTIDQLGDEDADRSAIFRQNLESFLELSSPLEPFTHEKVNYFVGAESFEETVDLCDDRYNDLRSMVLNQGNRTASWILDNLLLSADITVANRDHFEMSLSEWGNDPCTIAIE